MIPLRLQSQIDQQFKDTQEQAVLSASLPPVEKAETFEAHRHTWTAHDSIHSASVPCDSNALVYILRKDQFIPEKPMKAEFWAWGVEPPPNSRIIGWRYATPPQEVNTDYQPTEVVESDQAAIHHAGSFMKEFRKGESLNMWDDEKSTPPQEKDEHTRLREENERLIEQRNAAREDARRLAAHVEKWREELEESCGGRGRIAELGIELDLAAHRNLNHAN